MFDYLEEKFSKRKKSQRRVVEFLLRYGIRVGKKDKKLYFSENIEIPISSIARVLNLDRRIVKSTIETVSEDRKLRKIFSKLNSALLLRDVAPELGFGAIEIIPTSASSRGIIAGVTKIISDAGISIRQLTAEDPMFENAEMSIVTEKPIPRELIDEILKIKGVKKVIVLS
jgi:hypothetical protein